MVIVMSPKRLEHEANIMMLRYLRLNIIRMRQIDEILFGGEADYANCNGSNAKS
jgi:hypothetical protein